MAYVEEVSHLRNSRNLEVEYLEDNPMTWIRGLPNHGDRFRPLRIGLWDPFHSWPKFMACKCG